MKCLTPATLALAAALSLPVTGCKYVRDDSADAAVVPETPLIQKKAVSPCGLECRCSSACAFGAKVEKCLWCQHECEACLRGE